MNSQVAIFTTTLLLSASSLGLPTQASTTTQAPVHLAQARTPVTYTTLAGMARL
ncbi:MAG: hypothetical protein HC929_13595 [Leptolyngbyaceae cyanobacterium SM2_5_2]|nr:hypothetical protein [Leptolyngbyaceae cyanobacterium SM2_5_2]